MSSAPPELARINCCLGLLTSPSLGPSRLEVTGSVVGKRPTDLQIDDDANARLPCSHPNLAQYHHMRAGNSTSARMGLAPVVKDERSAPRAYRTRGWVSVENDLNLPAREPATA